MFEKMPDVLTIQETADALRVSKRSVRHLMNDNKLEYRKIGRIYRISKISLLKYLGENPTNTDDSATQSSRD